MFYFRTMCSARIVPNTNIYKIAFILRRMVYEKISIHPLNLEKAKETLKKHSPTEQEHKKALAWLKTKSVEKGLTERRQLRLLGDFTSIFKIYPKPIGKITLKELIGLKEDFLNKRVLTMNGEPYSPSVIEGISETLVRYLEDTYPNRMSSFILNKKPLRSWFIIRAEKKTPEILTEAEIKKLYHEAKTLWGKYLIAVLFGSGARIEEFLNFRFEDIKEPTKNFPYYKIDIKKEYSKTEGREIGLYWEYCTEATAKYLASIEKKDSKDRVLDKDYDAVRIYLSRLGRKVLNKRIYPHMFRKSSATFNASRLNRQQLCKRFGWKFSSDVVDVYINRAGVDEIEVEKVMLDDDVSKMRQENNELRTRLDLIERKFEEQLLLSAVGSGEVEAKEKARLKKGVVEIMQYGK